MSSTWTRLRGWWLGHKAQLEKLFEDYGGMAIGTWLVLFALTFTGFYLAIEWGLASDSGVATMGTVGAAYAATRLTFPVRVIATLALTPLVVRWYRWVRRKETGSSDSA